MKGRIVIEVSKMENWSYQAKLFNFYVLRELLSLQREAKYSAEKMRAAQERKIREIVQSAARYPLYQKKIADAGLKPEEIHTPEQLAQVAPLTKEEYREIIEQTVKNDPEKYRYCHKGHTSGSTGMPLNVCNTPMEYAHIIAQLLFILSSQGYPVFRGKSMDMRSPSQTGSDAKSIVQKLGLLRKYYVSTLDDPEVIISRINEVQPDELKAGKSIMQSVLRYAYENKKTIYPVKYIVSSAEPMDDYTRMLIEHFFGSKALIDIYATIESGLIAYTANGDQSRFCLNNSDYLYSVCDAEGNPAEEGELRITNLFLKEFPMINYRQGDHVNFVKGEDGKMYLGAVTGRSNDYIITKDGKNLSILHIFPAIAAVYDYVAQYRFVQEDYDSLKLVLVRRPDSVLSEEQIEEKLRESLHKYVGDTLQYSFEWVDVIPVDKNDKIRVLINKMKR